jgi:outer membrane protein TolC
MNVRGLGAALLLGLPALLDAQSLSVGQAAQLVSERHPTVAAARASVARAQAGVQEAEAARLPTVGIDAALTQFQKPMVVAPIHSLRPGNLPEFDNTLIQGNLGANYTVYDGGLRGARIDRAEALASAAQAGEAGTRVNLLAEGVRAYLRVRTAREVLAAQERRVQALVSERDRATRVFDAGRAARLVLTRAEAALSSAQAEATSSRLEVQLAERELARLTGIDVERIHADSLRGLHPNIALKLPTQEAALAQARENNPELQRLRRQVAAAQQGRGEARSLWRPRLNMGGRFVEYAAGSGSNQGEWQGGVQVSYPIFTGGTRSAALERANADIAAAQAELGAAELRVADAIDRALSAFEAAHARTQALRDAVTQASEVTRIERLALDAGSGVQTDYIIAEADLFRVRAALTEASYTEVLARVELARVLGELSTNWIQQNLESGS